MVAELTEYEALPVGKGMGQAMAMLCRTAWCSGIATRHVGGILEMGLHPVILLIQMQESLRIGESTRNALIAFLYETNPRVRTFLMISKVLCPLELVGFPIPSGGGGTSEMPRGAR